VNDFGSFNEKKITTYMGTKPRIPSIPFPLNQKKLEKQDRLFRAGSVKEGIVIVREGGLGNI
jgi:hypothetical protein